MSGRPVFRLGEGFFVADPAFDGSVLTNRGAIKRRFYDPMDIVERDLTVRKVVGIANARKSPHDDLLSKLIDPSSYVDLVLEDSHEVTTLDRLKDEIVARINFDDNSREFWGEFAEDDFDGFIRKVRAAGTFDDLVSLLRLR